MNRIVFDGSGRVGYGRVGYGYVDSGLEANEVFHWILSSFRYYEPNGKTGNQHS